MPFDLKKEYKEYYLPPAKPVIVTVPKANYIAVRGKGNPNDEGGAFQQAIGVLYAIAYTLKMSYKTDHRIEGFYDYVVPPLEGFWQLLASRRIATSSASNLTRDILRRLKNASLLNKRDNLFLRCLWHPR